MRTNQKFSVMKSGNINWFTRYATVLTFIIICIFFILITDNSKFVEGNNISNIFRQSAILCIVALGLTFTLGVGEFDMSVGSIVGLTCTMCMGLVAKQGLTPVSAIIITILVGLTAGAINSIITIFCRIPSIIVTLGMQSVLQGVLYIYCGGKAMYGGSVPRIFVTLGQGNIGFIPVLVIVMILFIAFTYFILNKTLIGRYLYATGGNHLAARLSGINTNKHKIAAMMTCSAYAAIAGILLAARLGSGQPTAGESYTMEAMSAVFIGMTMIRPGRANVVGTVIGVLLLGVLSNGLNLMGVSYSTQNITKGVIMIAAVAIAASQTELKFFS